MFPFIFDFLATLCGRPSPQDPLQAASGPMAFGSEDTESTKSSTHEVGPTFFPRGSSHEVSSPPWNPMCPHFSPEDVSYVESYVESMPLAMDSYVESMSNLEYLVSST